MTLPIKDLRDIAVEGIDFVVSSFKDDWQIFATKYNFAFTEYFKAKAKNLSKLKPIFSPQVVDLQNIYVPQNIIIDSDTYTFNQINKAIKRNGKLILLGTAGAGKSCFSKSFFLRTIKNKNTYFPIFYELRKLNDSEKTIIDSLVEDIAEYNAKFSKENLAYVLGRKDTLLILDGFDEINFDKKHEYFQEITKLAETYPDLKFIVSSRAEEGLFIEWSLFTVAELQQLNLEQACEVIEKINYNSDVKTRFIDALKKSLFEQHEDFASNPLLLNIMLLTFEQISDIPSEMHIFYGQAYEALFNRHDSSKSGFKRQSLTNLDIRKFKIVFSLFCLTTYCKQQFEFEDKELQDTLRKCLDTTENNHVSTENMKRELLNNVPLLIQDGLKFCFAHRSFQEYFTAFYLAHHKQDMPYEVFDMACQRIATDSVADMLFEMNKPVLEKQWILPKIDKILVDMDKSNTYEARFCNMKKFYDAAWIHDMGDELIFLEDWNELALFAMFVAIKYTNQSQSFPCVHHSQETLFSIRERLGERIVADKLNKEQRIFFLENGGDVLAKEYISILREVKQNLEEQHESSKLNIEDLIFK